MATTILLIALTVLMTAIAGGLALWYRQQRGEDTDEAEEAAELYTLGWERLQKLVADALPYLITEAERRFGGGGTGFIKRAMVITEIMKLLPDENRSMAQDEVIIEWIEEALLGTRPAWEDAPKLIEPDGAADGTLVGEEAGEKEYITEIIYVDNDTAVAARAGRLVAAEEGPTGDPGPPGDKGPTYVPPDTNADDEPAPKPKRKERPAAADVEEAGEKKPTKKKKD